MFHRSLRIVRGATLVAVALVGIPTGSAATLDLDLLASRSLDSPVAQADQAVRAFARNAARLTEANRKAWHRAGRGDARIPFSIPTTVRLRAGGQLLPVSAGGPAPQSPLVLQFDGAGPGAFPPAERAFLEEVFAAARGTIDVVFGPPSHALPVRVRNFDAEIGDRDAIAGGFVLPNNGAGQVEIRFPIYQNREAAAVNFVHCLLLAYLGPNSYDFDAYQEGLVRAATMRIVRTPGALPATLSPDLIEAVLENTYDVGSFYDWYNQRGLGGRRFIAENLRLAPLPAGGSLGGVYLLRYQMAGSAWQKVLVEYPGFAAAFNGAFYADTSIAGNPAALNALAQSVIDTLAGSPGATVEGRPFAEWARRQAILETRDAPGLKLILQPVPLLADAGTSDFGVFLIQATLFQTLPNGHEVLQSGVSYPIFWSAAFDRVFPSTQEDRMDIAGAYGSVVPNLPNLTGGTPYRAAVDLPVQDRIARAFLPAGAYSTGSSPAERDLVGTVVGVPLGSGASLRVRLTFGPNTVDHIPVTDGAFGARVALTHPSWLNAQRVRVEVVRRIGGVDQTPAVIDRRVNKGPGILALDLRVQDGEVSFSPPGGLPRGLSAFGVPTETLAALPTDLVGLAANQLLFARWNGVRAAYDIFPDTGYLEPGAGYFVRMPAAVSGFSFLGRTSPGLPVSISLRPGWNLVASPLTESTPVSRIRVTRSVDFPKPYAEAVGQELGAEFFTFQPGPNDAATGAPETGSMVPATVFEPGRAYFVRVLAAEGVTLTFVPSSPVFAPLVGPGRGVFAASAAGSSVASPAPDRNRWRMRIRLTQSGRQVWAELGQSAVATDGFDPRQDAGLAPGAGGPQVQIGVADRLYRDMRRTGENSRYRVKLENLRPGTAYSIRFERVEGFLPRLTYWDTATGASMRIVDGTSLTFRARSTEHVFDVAVRWPY
ncbi:MAG: hypothetical protein SNJ74_02035 [Fimbriimonadaceae bacterium]